MADATTDFSKDYQAGEWWTAPAEGDGGGLVIVTGRKDIAKFRKNPKFHIRGELSLTYASTPDGMPGPADARILDALTQAFLRAFSADPVAVVTGIFTGDGSRTWAFYTLSHNIFSRKVGEILALPEFDGVNVSGFCTDDPAWEQYDEMAELEIE